jgi:hypothetical protein
MALPVSFLWPESTKFCDSLPMVSFVGEAQKQSQLSLYNILLQPPSKKGISRILQYDECVSSMAGVVDCVHLQFHP